MIEKQDRRSFLKAAAATSALGAVGAPPAEAAATSVGQSRTRRARALLLRGAEARRRSASSTSPIARRTSRRPRSPRRSTTRRGARSPTTPITRSSPTRRSASRSSSSTSACSSRRPSASMWSRTARRARSSTTPTISTCRRIRSRANFRPAPASPASAFRKPKDGPLDWKKNDWVAFLGASYFRAIGELRQYGLSARGVALDTWQAGRPEEFPDFTNVYIGPETAGRRRPARRCSKARPSSAPIAFLMTRGKGVVMDIDCSLYLRGELHPLRHRAAHLDVLVLRDDEADRRRLAARRCTIPTGSACGPARASACGGRSTIRRASWRRPSATPIPRASA